MNVKQELGKSLNPSDIYQLNNIELDSSQIKAIMINEVVPFDPTQDFYGSTDAEYLSTTIPLFQKAGADVHNIQDILEMGIYITNAVKTPKTEYAIERKTIEDQLPILEKELSLFPNIEVIMLMGDVAKKAYNMITKKETGKNAVPAISTYKIRNTEIYHGSIRVLPSYIMTGANLLIEKSKFQMASEDIALMISLIE